MISLERQRLRDRLRRYSHIEKKISERNQEYLNDRSKLMEEWHEFHDRVAKAHASWEPRFDDAGLEIEGEGIAVFDDETRGMLDYFEEERDRNAELLGDDLKADLRPLEEEIQNLGLSHPPANS